MKISVRARERAVRSSDRTTLRGLGPRVMGARPTRPGWAPAPARLGPRTGSIVTRPAGNLAA
jgi:hypothetical protein